MLSRLLASDGEVFLKANHASKKTSVYAQR